MATNVSTGKAKVGGYLYAAPYSESLTLPTDATTALDAAFVSAGFVSEDGFKITPSISVEKVKDATGQVVAEYNSAYEETSSFKLIDTTNKVACQLAYGTANVSYTESASGTKGKYSASRDGSMDDRWALVYETVMLNGDLKRQVVPCAQRESFSDQVYGPGEVMAFDLTFGHLAINDGKASYEYYAEV